MGLKFGGFFSTRGFRAWIGGCNLGALLTSDDCVLALVPVSNHIGNVDPIHFRSNGKGKNMRTQLRRCLTLSLLGIFSLVMSQTSRGQTNLMVDPGFEIGTVTANPNTTLAPGWALFGGTPYEGENPGPPDNFVIPPGGQPTVAHSGVWDMEMPGGGGNFSVPALMNFSRPVQGKRLLFPAGCVHPMCWSLAAMILRSHKSRFSMGHRVARVSDRP